MEFLFPLVVLALGGTMVYFRWRSRQRRRLYGAANASGDMTAVMTGVSAATGEDDARRSDASSTAASADTGPASARRGDGYTGTSSESGSSSSPSSDGGGSGGDGGGGTS
ncbi:MAG TPA: hypothetical protein VFK32_09265 [Tepidiformaceae bacterium]|nr:hypothetical protein [Tepidiformaceae bacterium]